MDFCKLQRQAIWCWVSNMIARQLIARQLIVKTGIELRRTPSQGGALLLCDSRRSTRQNRNQLPNFKGQVIDTLLPHRLVIFCFQHLIRAQLKDGHNQSLQVQSSSNDTTKYNGLGAFNGWGGYPAAAGKQCRWWHQEAKVFAESIIRGNVRGGFCGSGN